MSFWSFIGKLALFDMLFNAHSSDSKIARWNIRLTHVATDTITKTATADAEAMIT